MRNLILIILTLISFQQLNAQKRIQGIVKDNDSKKPIEHVLIIGNRSGKTTVTNSEGRFQMNVAEEDTKIIFRHLSYFTKEMALTEASVLNVDLKIASEDLEEIVILNTSIRNEINRVIKASQARFSNNLKLNTYYRELMYINGTMYQYEDAELDYYLRSINKSNVIVRESRSVKFTNETAKSFDSLTHVNYYWGDLRERISYEFEFKLIKDIISDKEYSLYITSKTDMEGTELYVLNFSPVENAKKAMLQGTMVYGAKDDLIREIKVDLATDFINNSDYRMYTNHLFKRSFYNRTTLFSLHNNKYALAYVSYRVFGVSEVQNQLTQVGGFVELLIDSIEERPVKPNSNDFYQYNKLTRLGKNYRTKYWQKFNVVPLTFKEEQMLKEINK